MVAVIFEVVPHEEHKETYFALAAALKTSLEKMDGFISVERFQSLTEPGKLLSLSFWKDEAGIQQWRTLEQHRQAQAQGRDSIFSDYRLRIAMVSRDYGLFDRKEAPADSRQFHDGQV